MGLAYLPLQLLDDSVMLFEERCQGLSVTKEEGGEYRVCLQWRAQRRSTEDPPTRAIVANRIARVPQIRGRRCHRECPSD